MRPTPVDLLSAAKPLPTTKSRPASHIAWVAIDGKPLEVRTGSNLECYEWLIDQAWDRCHDHKALERIERNRKYSLIPYWEGESPVDFEYMSISEAMEPVADFA